MRFPRGLTRDEAEAWARLAASVTPLAGMGSPFLSARALETSDDGEDSRANPPKPKPKPNPPPVTRAVGARPVLNPAGRGGLDSHWDRRLKTGSIAPDFTLDLHGHGLDAAHDRLISGIAQARVMGARLVLLVAGKQRPADPADRGTRRGAIRAKALDWLAASEHAGAIAAIRKAHPRHGGEGALYVVLRR